MPQAPSLRTDEFFTIFIRHLPTSQFVEFEGWVTEFSDQFSSNWSSTSVYGRMDPLPAFENTQRTISLGFDVVSDSITQAEDNLNAIANLIKFQYPVYESSERAAQNTLKAAPLIQMKWTNLISDASELGYLTGYLNGVTYGPDITEGGFVATREVGAEVIANGEIRKKETIISDPGTVAARLREQTDQEVIVNRVGGKTFIPKKVSIQLTFNVLHTHLTGWYRDEKNGGGYHFGSRAVSGKYPNATYEEYIISQTAAPADSEIVGTSDFNRAGNNAQVLEGN